MLWSDKYERDLKMDALQKIIILVLAVMLIFNMDKCRQGSGSTATSTIVRDTTIITHIDTVWVKDTITHNLFVDKPVYVYIDSSDTGRDFREIAVYENIVKDSLIDGKITTEVEGELVNLTFDYTPLFPQYINRTDTVLIYEKETITEQRNKAFLGAEVGGNLNSFDVSPMIALKTKTDMLVSYRYGVISKTHNLGIMVALRNPLSAN